MWIDKKISISYYNCIAIVVGMIIGDTAQSLTELAISSTSAFILMSGIWLLLHRKQLINARS